VVVLFIIPIVAAGLFALIDFVHFLIYRERPMSQDTLTGLRNNAWQDMSG
jgi:hypothetical protein